MWCICNQTCMLTSTAKPTGCSTTTETCKRYDAAKAKDVSYYNSVCKKCSSTYSLENGTCICKYTYTSSNKPSNCSATKTCKRDGTTYYACKTCADGYVDHILVQVFGMYVMDINDSD